MAQVINGQVQYAPGEALPSVGSSAYVAAQNGQINPANSYTGETPSPSTPITGINTAPNSPIVVAPTPAPVATAGLQGAVTAATTQSQAALDQAAADAKITAEKTATTDAATAYRNRLTGQTTKSQAQSDAYSAVNDTGSSVNSATKDLNDINNQILSEQTGLNHQVDALKQHGGVSEGVNRAIAAVTRESVSKQADLAVIQQAKQNNYALAKSIADRQVDAKLESEKNAIDGLKFDYDNSKDTFTKDEDRQYQAMILKKQQDYDKKKDDLKTISDLSLTALQNGAPTATVLAIRKADTIDGALAAAGTYGVDTLRKLQIAKAQADLLTANQSNKVLSITDAAKLGVPYGTTVSQAAALGKVPGATSDANALKLTAVSSAKALLEKFQASKSLIGTNTAPVGISSVLGTIPGTKDRDFVVQFDNLKSLLNLDGIKYLKGTGQISDAEERLLSQASSKLDRSQSKAEFEQSLNEVIQSLSGTEALAPDSGDAQLTAMGYTPEQIQQIKSAK